MIEEQIEKKIEDAYKEKFPVSKERHEQLINYIPGGATRSLSYFKPYPIHIDYGQGAYVYTHEGHKLLDVTNAYGAIVHGHGDPDVVRAVRDGIAKGSQYSTPTDGQYKLAKLLCERVPGFDKVRFLNSGTEATLFVMRTARAYTGKDKILKMIGGFHGTHDSVAASTKKNVITAGIPEGMTEAILEVPFNDFDALEKTVKENASELAAVIMEPFLGAGGVVLPKPGYLEHVRKVTSDNNVLLIFDEIFSYRVNTGGCQKLFGVIPDLTTVGKVVGGGLPIGVFGGKEEIMNIFCHENTEKPLYHSGTFNGYETVMQAGYAALSKYDEAAVAYVNKLGDQFKNGLLESFKANRLNIQANQIGSLLNIHFVNEPITNADQVLKSEEQLHRLMHLSLLNKGIFTIPRGLFILSTAITEEEIDLLVNKIDETLKELLPLIEEKYNHLLL
ncbi:aspartate aminotransferase family protein [Desulfobacula toluolica]|uniref:Pat: predicted phenylalanine aminotransferase n=1 Tax=Desulfobacula toluolica (strain DSM 7467 / Tol2) TaxID=651182 RepID=K0NGE6_DESTT|nr:aspartate aminotransferase family protein [Desulfobacula toluolica]CCK79980.1 Pat: predicted phenylalanine aminotransferase [Desulfobacula toluolica Tol2]